MAGRGLTPGRFPSGHLLAKAVSDTCEPAAVCQANPDVRQDLGAIRRMGPIMQDTAPLSQRDSAVWSRTVASWHPAPPQAGFAYPDHPIVCWHIGLADQSSHHDLRARASRGLPDSYRAPATTRAQNMPMPSPAPIAAPRSRQRTRSSSLMVFSARISSGVCACVQMISGG